MLALKSSLTTSARAYGHEDCLVVLKPGMAERRKDLWRQAHGACGEARQRRDARCTAHDAVRCDAMRSREAVPRWGDSLDEEPSSDTQKSFYFLFFIYEVQEVSVGDVESDMTCIFWPLVGAFGGAFRG